VGQEGCKDKKKRLGHDFLLRKVTSVNPYVMEECYYTSYFSVVIVYYHCS